MSTATGTGPAHMYGGWQGSGVDPDRKDDLDSPRHSMDYNRNSEIMAHILKPIFQSGEDGVKQGEPV